MAPKRSRDAAEAAPVGDPDRQPEFVTKEAKVIVKCSLLRVMKLDAARMEKFVGRVEEFVNVVSRSLRRSSLLLHHHLVRLEGSGSALPDLYRQKDTYWKRLLTAGIDGAFPDAEVEETFKDVGHLIGPVYRKTDEGPAPGYLAAQPKFYDQVLAYAAETFETAVCNNAWVPLFARLGRVLKLIMNRELKIDRKVATAGQVMRVLRGPNPQQDEDFQTWPPALQELVTEVRSRLRADADAVLYDQYGKNEVPFSIMYKFNFWMQRRLEALKCRRLRLSPIFKVRRAHVRLDRKVLLALLGDLFPGDSLIRQVRDADKEHATDVKTEGHGHHDPKRIFKVPAPKWKKRKECTAEEWDAQKKLRSDLQEEQARLRAQPAYAEQLRRHEEYERLKTRAIAKFFQLPRKTGWDFDGSVTTDGVSVSLQFSRQILVPKAPSGGRATKRRRSDSVQQVEDYDRGQSMRFELDGATVIVLGLDPGRVSLATVATEFDVTDADGRRRTWRKEWKLSRGRYYHESGIRAENKAQRRRYAHLIERWTELGHEGAALQSGNSKEHTEYLRQYEGLHDAWWTFALAPVESKASLRRYSGKRSVLDGFFARIRKFMRRRFPDARLVVAYGSAVSSLSKTKSPKYEVAAPVSDTYLACRRVFGSDLEIENEDLTTQVDWRTGVRKLAAYKEITEVSGRVVERLRPLQANRRPPAARPEDVQLVQAYMARVRFREHQRRGGRLGDPDHTKEEEKKDDDHEEDERGKHIVRYPEVRGLRFCPEDRKFRDRDLQSALAIGKLCCMRLLNLGRPRAFCTQPRNRTAPAA